MYACTSELQKNLNYKSNVMNTELRIDMTSDLKSVDKVN